MGSTRPIFLGLILLLCVLGCSSPSASSRNSSSGVTEDKPQLYMKPIRVQAYGIHGLEWDLEAPLAQNYPEKNIIHATDMDLTLYQEGTRSSRIQAGDALVSAKLNQKDGNAQVAAEFKNANLRPGDMLLRNYVVVTSTDGTKIMTDWARYNKQEEIITSTAPVKVIREDSITEGTGLRATPDLSSLEIFDQTLTIKGQDEEL